MKIEREEFEREKNYLNKTVSLVRKKISSLGQQLYDDDSKVLEFKKFIWDSHAEMDPSEMRSMMAESDLQVSIMQITMFMIGVAQYVVCSMILRQAPLVIKHLKV